MWAGLRTKATLPSLQQRVLFCLILASAWKWLGNQQHWRVSKEQVLVPGKRNVSDMNPELWPILEQRRGIPCSDWLQLSTPIWNIYFSTVMLRDYSWSKGMTCSGSLLIHSEPMVGVMLRVREFLYAEVPEPDCLLAQAVQFGTPWLLKCNTTMVVLVSIWISLPCIYEVENGGMLWRCP